MQTYTATLSSNEVDADTLDNSASGTVTVSSVDAGGADEENGAGTTGPIFLWLLVVGALMRYRRRH